jgi:sugar phosphate isomerase/epimerase
MYVVESLAPYSFTTHIKDMGIQDYEDGFLLSEVPLGTGQLDLKKIIEICRRHNPDIKFNLEMITRNPLEVPIYTDQYWATFQELPASKMMGALKWVRNHQSQSALPSVEGMSDEEKLVYEEKNIVDSISYAIDELKL